MISNLSLLFLALAKVALYCGFLPALALIVWFEKVSARAVSQPRQATALLSSSGNQPARKVRVRIA